MRVLRLLAVLAPLVAGLRAATPETVSVRKIWDQGAHNAFTDLIRFRDRWYCVFREAEAHVGGDGEIRVLVSSGGESWQPAALVAEAGIDLRDPKLSITPDGRLMLLAGGSVYQGKTLMGRRPRVSFSSDGGRWTPAEPILANGDWLWRVTWQQGNGYGVSYPSGVLYVTSDGRRYERVAELEVPGCSEVTLRFLAGGEMVALVRRELDPRHGWIGSSRPPYVQWQWKEIGRRLGGPNFIPLPDDTLWAAGREHTPEGPKTVVARMTRDSYQPALTLPSGGDTSYPGLIWHNGLLWMSYYSSHEGKSSIYLARIRMRP